jgi:hypothetical protein
MAAAARGGEQGEGGDDDSDPILKDALYTHRAESTAHKLTSGFSVWCRQIACDPDFKPDLKVTLRSVFERLAKDEPGVDVRALVSLTSFERDSEKEAERVWGLDDPTLLTSLVVHTEEVKFRREEKKPEQVRLYKPSPYTPGKWVPTPRVRFLCESYLFSQHWSGPHGAERLRRESADAEVYRSVADAIGGERHPFSDVLTELVRTEAERSGGGRAAARRVRPMTISIGAYNVLHWLMHASQDIHSALVELEARELYSSMETPTAVGVRSALSPYEIFRNCFYTCFPEKLAKGQDRAAFDTHMESIAYNIPHELVKDPTLASNETVLTAAILAIVKVYCNKVALMSPAVRIHTARDAGPDWCPAWGIHATSSGAWMRVGVPQPPDGPFTLPGARIEDMPTKLIKAASNGGVDIAYAFITACADALRDNSALQVAREMMERGFEDEQMVIYE